MPIRKHHRLCLVVLQTHVCERQVIKCAGSIILVVPKTDTQLIRLADIGAGEVVCGFHAIKEDAWTCEVSN